MCVQKNEALKKSWYQNVCSETLKGPQKCVFRRFQKCVFIKNDSSQKVLISKFLYTEGLKNVCSKNEALKKSWYQNFSIQKVSKTCVQKLKLSKSPVQKNEYSQKVLISKFPKTEGLKNVCSIKMKLSKSPDIKISLHRRSQKCVFKKMKLSKSPDIKILYTEGLKNVCSKKWSSQKVLISKFR